MNIKDMIMRKLFLLILVCFVSFHCFAQNYVDADLAAMAKADSVCSVFLNAYKENDVYTKGELLDKFKYEKVPNLTKCRLAYFKLRKYYVDNIYEVEIWFQKEDESLFKFDCRYFVKDNLLEFFDDYFILGDYRKKYPKVRRWEQIRQGKVSIGMTKEECKLSIGRPRDVNTTTLSSGTKEQWVYDYRYVYFRNGVVTAIQN